MQFFNDFDDVSEAMNDNQEPQVTEFETIIMGVTVEISFEIKLEIEKDDHEPELRRFVKQLVASPDYVIKQYALDTPLVRSFKLGEAKVIEDY